MTEASKMELEVKQKPEAKEGLDLRFIYTMAEGAIAERDVKDANKMIKMGLEQAIHKQEGEWINKFKSIRSELSDLPHVPSAARVAAVKGDLTVIKGIGPSAADKLKNAGINTVAQLAGKTPNQLSEINGIGLETARRMINSARESEKNAIKPEKGVVIEGVKPLTVKPRKQVLAGGTDSFIAKPKEVIVNEGKEIENKKEKEKEKIKEEIKPEPEIKEIFYDEGQEYGVNALIKGPKNQTNNILEEREREEKKEEKEDEEDEEEEDYFGLESDYEQEEVKEIKKIGAKLEKEGFSELEERHDVQEKESEKELTPNTAPPEASLGAIGRHSENDMDTVINNF